jgi:hypothetical protein
MLIDKRFEVVLASPPDYEELTAEIYFNGKFVALVNQENGRERLEVEFPKAEFDETAIIRAVDLNGFLDALEFARNRLQGEKQQEGQQPER